MKKTTMTRNGVSTCKAGEEQYQTVILGALRGKEYIQYDYRHWNGELLAIVRTTLDECRKERDKFIREQEEIMNSEAHVYTDRRCFEKMIADHRRDTHYRLVDRGNDCFDILDATSNKHFLRIIYKRE